MLTRMILATKKFSRLLLLIFSLAVFVFMTIVKFSRIEGNFFQCLTDVIMLIVTMAMTIAVPLLLILKKDEPAKTVFTIVGAYFILMIARPELEMAVMIGEYWTPFDVAWGIFSVLFGLTILVILTFVVLQYIFPAKNFIKVIYLLFCFLLVVGLVVMILEFAVSARNNFATSTYFRDAADFCLIPFTLFFGYLHFYIDDLY